MRVQLASDLHLEFDRNFKFRMNPANRDVLVLAGDIHLGDAAESFIARELKYSPVVYVAGNHEFYDGEIKDVRERLRKLASKYPDLHYLDQESVVLDDVTFIGGTLWSNFDNGNAVAMHHARVGMNDYNIVKYGECAWEPELAYDEHLDTLDAFEDAIRDRTTEKVVVVSHMAPHLNSLAGRYKESLLNPAYASDLSAFIDEMKPNLWVHGHIHVSRDYMVGSTRIRSNPRGYSGYEINEDFDAGLILEV
jgi:Icc-related predicted phosphoesterase